MITRTTRWIAASGAAAALVLGSAGVAFASQGADDPATHDTRTAPATASPVVTGTAAPAPVADDHGGLRTGPEAVHHHNHGAPHATTAPVAPAASPSAPATVPSPAPSVADDHGVHAPGTDDRGGASRGGSGASVSSSHGSGSSGSGSGSSGSGSSGSSGRGGHDDPAGDDHGGSGHGSDG
ncbi:hypothetical protein [Frondihabitans australicus]|uniref:Uncharacterized protein n=1 Tax=Frondihabitans australicus TaxID=386892 RepID=A0A495IJF3_9MICO|nr:hypothetical protein [Frondihabitans australicus]RKR75255.1 hypothetical protein C8E83_2394 [Frondihabitans australicus]